MTTIDSLTEYARLCSRIELSKRYYTQLAKLDADLRALEAQTLDGKIPLPEYNVKFQAIQNLQAALRREWEKAK